MFLKSLIIFILRKLPLKKVILFESYPELSGSPWKIYQEMLKRGYDKKYNLIWAVDSSFRSPPNIKSVPFFGKLSKFQYYRRFLYNSLAKLNIDSNRPLYKNNSETIRIFTRHGGPLKKCPEYMHYMGQMDYMLTLSPNMQEIDFIDCKDFCVQKKEDILALGFPANDCLFEKKDLFENGFYPRHGLTQPQNKFNKIIGWLPTFRQHRNKDNSSGQKPFPLGIPLIYSEKELIQLNDFLSKENILLAIQMHHAQVESFPKLKFSNIILISQAIKYEMDVSTANLMQSFDAMITDYSAAYHEYILLDRPIALTIDDFNEYSSKTGFVFDYFDWIKGVYLKDSSDLIRFIKEVSDGVDSAKKERESAMHRIHKYIDNQSTTRVLDFLIKKAGL